MAELHTCAEVADRYGVKIITVWSWIRTVSYTHLTLPTNSRV